MTYMISSDSINQSTKGSDKTSILIVRLGFDLCFMFICLSFMMDTPGLKTTF